MSEKDEITPAMRRFARKVRWEGGVLNAIDYGMHSNDVPDAQIALTWAEAEDLYGRLRPILSRLDEFLEAA